MTQADIHELNNIIGIAMSATERALDVSNRFFTSTGIKNLQCNDPVLFEFPNLRQIISETDLSWDNNSKKELKETVIGLSDRLIALKVLLSDLAPFLEGQVIRYDDISAYYPYLTILMEQIERDRDEIEDWFNDNLQGRFDSDLRENQDYESIRRFIDKSLSAYADVHADANAHQFREYVLCALDKFVDGEDYDSFSFSFGTEPQDSGFGWLNIELDGCISVSLNEFIDGPFGGDSEQYWMFSLWENGESEGSNGIDSFDPVCVGQEWKLDIASPDEFYCSAEGSDDDTDL